MFKKIEEFLFNKFAGKLLARAAVTIAAYAASAPAQAILSKAGISVTVDPAEMTAGMIAGAHAAYEWFKKRRADKAAEAEKKAGGASPKP